MSKSRTTNIVRMDWLRNRTPTGRRSATGARKLAMYLGYGRGRQAEQEQRAQRGQWLDQKGEIRSHQEVIEWVNEQGKENLYTHQFILSVKEAQLPSEAFNRAMSAGGGLFQEWRLISHNDSRYSHAHAISFGQKEILVKSGEFKEWWQGVRQALEQEQNQALQQERQLQQEQKQEQKVERSIEQAGDRPTSEQSIEHSISLPPEEERQQLEQTEAAVEIEPVEERQQQRGWGLGY
jgi:hypothetical protein